MTLTKLLAGVLALVLVAGMTSPAFAGEPTEHDVFFCGITHSPEFIQPNDVVEISICVDSEPKLPEICPGLSEDVEILILDPLFGSFVLETDAEPEDAKIITNSCETTLDQKIITFSISINPSNPNIADAILNGELQILVIIDPNNKVAETDESNNESTEILFFDSPAVGGAFVPIDNSALILAGAQSISMWMIPTVLGLAGVGVYLVKFRKH